MVGGLDSGKFVASGVPVGREITDLRPVLHNEFEKEGSILVVIATDGAPAAASIKTSRKARSDWCGPDRRHQYELIG